MQKEKYNVTTEAEQQKEFMIACNMPRFTLREVLLMGPHHPKIQYNMALWQRLIQEEVVNELFKILNKIRSIPYSGNPIDDITLISDGIIDGKYVLDGLGNCLGLPLDKIFEEIHRTNMAKTVLRADGTRYVLRRADGKILKPDGWTPPDIKSILQKELGEQNGDSATRT